MASVFNEPADPVWTQLMVRFINVQLHSADKKLLKKVLDKMSSNPRARAVLAPIKEMIYGRRSASSDDIYKAGRFLQPRMLGYALVKTLLESIGIKTVNLHEDGVVADVHDALLSSGINYRIRFLSETEGALADAAVKRSDLENFIDFVSADEVGFRKGVLAILVHEDAVRNAVVTAGNARKAVKYLILASLREFFKAYGMTEQALDEAGIKWDAQAERNGGKALEYYIGPNGIAKTLAGIKGYPLAETLGEAPEEENVSDIAKGEVSSADSKTARLATWLGVNLRLFRELKPFRKHVRVRKGAADAEEGENRQVIKEARELLKLLDSETRAGRETVDQEFQEAGAGKTIHQFANEIDVALFDPISPIVLEKSAKLLKAIQERNEGDFIDIVSVSGADDWQALLQVVEGFRTQLQDTYFKGDAYDEKREAAIALCAIANFICRKLIPFASDVRDARVLEVLYNIYLALKDTIITDLTDRQISALDYLRGELADPETTKVYNWIVLPFLKGRQKPPSAIQDPAGAFFIHAGIFAQLDLNTMTLYLSRGDWYHQNPFAVAALLAFATEIVRAPEPGKLKDAVTALRRIEDRLEENYKKANGGQRMPAHWRRMSDILASAATPRAGAGLETEKQRKERAARVREALEEGRLKVLPGGKSAPGAEELTEDRERWLVLSGVEDNIKHFMEVEEENNARFVSERLARGVEDWTPDDDQTVNETNVIRRLFQRSAVRKTYLLDVPPEYPEICILAGYRNAIDIVGYFLGDEDGKDESAAHVFIRLRHVFSREGVEESIGRKVAKMVGLFQAGATQAQNRGFKRIRIEYSPGGRLTDPGAKTEQELRLEEEIGRLKAVLRESKEPEVREQASLDLTDAQAELDGMNEGALYVAFREALESQGYKVAKIEPAKPGANAELIIDIDATV